MKIRNYISPTSIGTAVILGTLIFAVGPSKADFQNGPKAIIDEVWQVVDREYVDTTFNHQNWSEIRKKYLAKDYKNSEAAYRGVRDMLKTLGDPYTRFMDPKQYQSMQVDTSGEFQGVGIQLGLDKKTKDLIVVAPIEDTPAYVAGVKPKDILLTIDGHSTKGLDLDKAVSQIRGAGGTTVILKFRRDTQTLTFSLVRTRIELKPVKYSLRTDAGQRVGYVRLTQFNANSARDMRLALEKLNADKVDGYILDLRSNPGGLLYASAEIARFWLGEGTIVSTVDRDGQKELISANRPPLTNKPLVVLVDGGSASASEILSGALQDNHRAVLVGTKTFGKGLVQQVHPLSDGSGMAVTIAHYQTPSGRDINKKGIEPDYKVEISKEVLKNFKPEQVATMDDPQYARAFKVLTQKIAVQNGTPIANDPLVSTP
ncbi:MAG: PDZ domain-containing protein [Anaerolineae bacterium]|nr:PDZ domain-containing protein [Gloeobacterales cyanobacterium ES-bin-313]